VERKRSKERKSPVDQEKGPALIRERDKGTKKGHPAIQTGYRVSRQMNQ
jgi:hypothetical protein